MGPRLRAVRGCRGSTPLHRLLMQRSRDLGCWSWGPPGCRVPGTQPLLWACHPHQLWLQPLEVTADLQLRMQSHFWRGGQEPGAASGLLCFQATLGAGWLLACRTSTRNKIWHPQPSPVIPVSCSWMQGAFGDPSLPMAQLSVGPPGRDAGSGNILQLPSQRHCPMGNAKPVTGVLGGKSRISAANSSLVALVK